MAKEVCVFCGQAVGSFRSDLVYCGDRVQLSCKDCAKELKDVSPVERCRRALRLGLAEQPEKIQEFITLEEESEQFRFSCLRCGEKLRFGTVESLDNSPMHDGIFSNTFDMLPAYCGKCGKIELYDPVVLMNNKNLAHLVKKDTAKG